MTELHAIITGRVQMVMYRDFAQRKGSGLGLVGTVQNLQDGSVELIVQGERSILERYVEKLKHGSMLARVDNVEVQWRNPTRSFDAFSIVY
jgi:acylphosphatase